MNTEAARKQTTIVRRTCVGERRYKSWRIHAYDNNSDTGETEIGTLAAAEGTENRLSREIESERRYSTQPRANGSARVGDKGRIVFRFALIDACAVYTRSLLFRTNRRCFLLNARVPSALRRERSARKTFIRRAAHQCREDGINRGGDAFATITPTRDRQRPRREVQDNRIARASARVGDECQIVFRFAHLRPPPPCAARYR